MWDALTFGTRREAPYETVQVICLHVVVCSYSATFIETTVSLPRNAQRLQVLKAVALPFRIDCRGGTAFRTCDDGTAAAARSLILLAFPLSLLHISHG